MSEDAKWTRASLRIFSETLPPERIARALGVQPDQSFRVGDPVSPRRPDSPVRKKHGFFLESGVSTDLPLENHLEALVERIEPFIDRLREIRGEVDADVFCGFSSGNGQGGFTFTPELLAQFARLGLDLGLDLYPPGEHDV